MNLSKSSRPIKKLKLKRSCKRCRKNHIGCNFIPQPDGSLQCEKCLDHGVECEQEDIVERRESEVLGDGYSILYETTFPQEEAQNPRKSDNSIDHLAEATKTLRIRQDLTEKNVFQGANNGTNKELQLDDTVEAHIITLFFDKVQPYIPIITRSWFGSIKPSQLLLSAIYGVAARVPGAIVSFRDFNHIKDCLRYQLTLLLNDYKPSLQACIALTLIHLTLELQCDNLDGVHAWPLRLGMAVRMAQELKLHKQAAQSRHPPVMQEMRRRLFWAIFCKDRWTSTGKGFPLMISLEDIDIDPPTSKNLDSDLLPPHYFFVELIQQAVVLGKLHGVSFRADRFQHVSKESFQQVEREVNGLRHRLSQNLHYFTEDQDGYACLELNYAVLRMRFYEKFFKLNNEAEKTLVRELIPNTTGMMIDLYGGAIAALRFASKELINSNPAIWGITYYAQLMCFLVAMKIKYDVTNSFKQDLREDAISAYEKVFEIGDLMCREKWSFKLLSGSLVCSAAIRAKESEREKRKGKSRETFVSNSIISALPVQIQPTDLSPSTNILDHATPTTDVTFENQFYIGLHPISNVEPQLGYQFQPNMDNMPLYGFDGSLNNEIGINPALNNILPPESSNSYHFGITTQAIHIENQLIPENISFGNFGSEFIDNVDNILNLNKFNVFNNAYPSQMHDSEDADGESNSDH